MNFQRCDFCYTHFSPPSYYRAPSGACNTCFTTIAAALAALPEPDWGAWAKQQPGYMEPDGWVIQ